MLLVSGQCLSDHCVGNGRAQIALVVAQGFQRVLEFGRRGVLEQVAMGSGLQRLHDQGRVGVHREDQDLALRAHPLELLQGFEAAGLAHRNIQQDNIRGETPNHFEQLRAVTGLTDDGIAGQIHYQGAHASPDQRVVIHQ
ncbi:hypothetical protein D9M69_448360 [compost metagenome]